MYFYLELQSSFSCVLWFWWGREDSGGHVGWERVGLDRVMAEEMQSRGQFGDIFWWQKTQVVLLNVGWQKDLKLKGLICLFSNCSLKQAGKWKWFHQVVLARERTLWKEQRSFWLGHIMVGLPMDRTNWICKLQSWIYECSQEIHVWDYPPINVHIKLEKNVEWEESSRLSWSIPTFRCQKRNKWKNR